MPLSIRRWGPRQLLLTWGAYWLSLVLITLGPALLAIWRVSRLPDGHGSVSAGIDDGLAQMTVIADGATLWSGSARLLTITLWLAGPPLALWAAWLATRPRRGEMQGLRH